MSDIQPTLPPEIWLEILSYLEYNDLSTLPSVIKYFNQLLRRISEPSHTTIDKILYRDYPTPLPPLRESWMSRYFYFHPIFRNFFSLQNPMFGNLSPPRFDKGVVDIYHRHSNTRHPDLDFKDEVFGWLYDASMKLLPNSEGKQWTENAFSPPLASVQIRLLNTPLYPHRWDVPDVLDSITLTTNGEGITVTDVVMCGLCLQYLHEIRLGKLYLQDKAERRKQTDAQWDLIKMTSFKSAAWYFSKKAVVSYNKFHKTVWLDLEKIIRRSNTLQHVNGDDFGVSGLVDGFSSTL